MYRSTLNKSQTSSSINCLLLSLSHCTCDTRVCSWRDIFIQSRTKKQTTVIKMARHLRFLVLNNMGNDGMWQWRIWIKTRPFKAHIWTLWKSDKVSIFVMPRVFPDQQKKFESDEVFKKLSQESDVRVTGLQHFYFLIIKLTDKSSLDVYIYI